MVKFVNAIMIWSAIFLFIFGTALIVVSYLPLNEVKVLFNSFDPNGDFRAFSADLLISLRFKGTLLCVAGVLIFMGRKLMEAKNNQIILRHKNVSIPLISILCSLLVYLFTLPLEVFGGDSAELAFQAYQLGVTHSMGYPVHTILGKLFSLAFHEPAIATKLMSAISSSLTVGLLSFYILRTTNDGFASILAPLIFAFTQLVWSQSVITEVYTINIFLFTLSLYLILSWHRSHSNKLLILSATVFGISLGSYLTNAILLPAFIFLIFFSGKKNFVSLMLFLSVFAAAGCLMLSWNYFRSDVRPLFSQYEPNSLSNLILFVTGAEAGTTEMKDIDYSLKKFIEHGYLFSRSFLFIGLIPGVLGFLYQLRKYPVEFFTLFLVFIINTVFFIVLSQGGGTYIFYLPTFLILTFWIGYGIHYLSLLPDKYRLKTISRISIIIIVLGLLFIQMPGILIRSCIFPVTKHVKTTFNDLPENSVVLARWQILTPLLYYQIIHNLRQDIILIEYNRTRQYDSGTITADSKYINRVITRNPVFVEKIWPDLKDKYKFKSLSEDWYQLEPLKAQLINGQL
jgi:hypothetical protein